MSKQKFTISAVAKDNKAVIRIDGEIQYWNNHAAAFKAKLDQLIADGITDATIYINSPGGDCFQANEIGNEISRFSGTLTAVLGALCASAVTYIACRCHKVIIAKNTSYMIHKPWGGVYGNSDELKSYLKLLANLEKEYVSVYAKKTGLTEDRIKELWATDNWMDSEECIELGFADEVEGEAEITPEDVSAISTYKNAPKISASIIKTINTDINKNSIQMKNTIITVLALNAESTETQVLAEVSALKAKADKADGYKAELDALKKSANEEKAEIVAEAGVKDKKYPAAQKEFYKKNLLTDFEGTKSMIDAMPAATKLSEQTQGDGTEKSEDRSKWTYADYQDKNPDALAALATTDEAKFKALFKAHFGTEC